MKQLENSTIFVVNDTYKSTLYDILADLGFKKYIVDSYSFYNAGYFIHIDMDMPRRTKSFENNTVIFESNTLAFPENFYVFENNILTKKLPTDMNVDYILTLWNRQDDNWMREILCRNFNQAFTPVESPKKYKVTSLNNSSFVFKIK